MGSPGAVIYRTALKFMGRQLQAAQGPAGIRSVFDRWSRWLPPAFGGKTEQTDLGGVPAVRVAPRHASTTSPKVILLLHGGGYVFGHAKGYSPLAMRLAKRTAAIGYALDYRLAPEHPYPAAVEDALTAYRSLLENHQPHDIALVGDSAGGGLAMTLMHTARDSGLPLPACAVLFSPWTDLTFSGESLTKNEQTEILLSLPMLSRLAAWYIGNHDSHEPAISPLFADHKGLPPLLIQVSATELIYSDAERLAIQTRQSGADVQLEVADDMWHVWQLMAPLVRESRAALKQAVEFINRHLSSG